MSRVDRAYLIIRMPNGRLIGHGVPEWAVEDAKRNDRDAGMPVVAVFRLKKKAMEDHDARRREETLTG